MHRMNILCGSNCHCPYVKCHRYTNAVFVNRHFMYGVAHGLAVQNIYVEQFLGRILPDPQTYQCYHWELYATESFYTSRCGTVTVGYRGAHAINEAVLRAV